MSRLTMNPKDLLNNPVNADLYGTQPDDDFVESVREHGVLEEIVADRDSLTIISGHRRRQAANICGLKEVPVRLVDVPDSAEQVMMLIESNRQRVKTKEQRAREFQMLKEVNELLAKRAQKEAGGANPGGASKGPKKRNPTAAEQAASEVGMSRPTAEKASEVVKAIDEAEKSGDTEKAAELRKELESGSVTGAHRKATQEKKMSLEDAEREGKAPNQWVNGLLCDLGSVENRIKLALESDKRGKGQLTVDRWGQEALTKIKNAKAVLKTHKPHDVCLTCKGKKKAKNCKDCCGSGWMTKRQLEIREAK